MFSSRKELRAPLVGGGRKGGRVDSYDTLLEQRAHQDAEQVFMVRQRKSTLFQSEKGIESLDYDLYESKINREAFFRQADYEVFAKARWFLTFLIGASQPTQPRAMPCPERVDVARQYCVWWLEPAPIPCFARRRRVHRSGCGVHLLLLPPHRGRQVLQGERAVRRRSLLGPVWGLLWHQCALRARVVLPRRLCVVAGFWASGS